MPRIARTEDRQFMKLINALLMAPDFTLDRKSAVSHLDSNGAEGYRISTYVWNANQTGKYSIGTIKNGREVTHYKLVRVPNSDPSYKAVELNHKRAAEVGPGDGSARARSYIALIHKDADSDFGVSFPDLPGCISAGSTLDEARSKALEALSLHLEGMRENGEPWPTPSSLETIMVDRENHDAVAFLVPVEDAASKIVRVNITMPEDVLSEIDSHAARMGATRSNFLKRAALHLIRQESTEASSTTKRTAKSVRTPPRQARKADSN